MFRAGFDYPSACQDDASGADSARLDGLGLLGLPECSACSTGPYRRRARSAFALPGRLLADSLVRAGREKFSNDRKRRFIADCTPQRAKGVQADIRVAGASETRWQLHFYWLGLSTTTGMVLAVCVW